MKRSMRMPAGHESLCKRLHGRGSRLARRLASSACLMMLCSPILAATPSTILEPAAGVYAAVADMGFCNFHDFADAASASGMDRPAWQIKKILDLSALPEEAWKALRTAELSIFMHVVDGKGDGLDEIFEIVVNGQLSTFPTEGLVWNGMGWFDHYQASAWFDFPIPAGHLTAGVNEIVIRRSPDAEQGDDALKVGIDTFQDNGCSLVSFDSGATWQQGPLNRPLINVGIADYGYYGEYMVRLSLYRDESLLGDKGFRHDDLPPLLEVDGVRLYSRDLAVVDREEMTAGEGVRKAVYFLRDERSGLDVNLSLELGESPELRAGLYLKNSGAEIRKVKMAFPLLAGVGWSDSFADDYYMMSASPLTGARAQNWEGFVGLNIARFYFPRHKHCDYEYAERHAEWRLFNATGAFNREWFYHRRELQILKENADAIGTLDPRPMIPTLMPQVYVNEFPAERKTIHTVYNARKRPVSGGLISVETTPDFHFVDLIHAREVRPGAREGKEVVLIVKLHRSQRLVDAAPVTVSR